MVAIDRYTPQIKADGGEWREVEVLGGRAVVKARASAATLTTIAADPDCRRIPLDLIDRPLSDLTNAQRTAIRNELNDMGYSDQEIRDRLGNNLATVTLRQVLRFMATRRVLRRFDRQTQTIVFDGPTVPCGSIDDLDVAVVL
jgi:hypothetical protein